MLVYTTSVYQATTVSDSARGNGATKSWLTGYWGKSGAELRLGQGLERVVFDATQPLGPGEQASLLVWIRDGKADIKDGVAFAVWKRMMQ